MFFLLRVSFPRHASHLFNFPTFPRSLIYHQDQDFSTTAPQLKSFSELNTAACRLVDTQDGEAGGELAA
jgi:hypothetical protein